MPPLPGLAEMNPSPVNTPIQIGRSYKEWWFLALLLLTVLLAIVGAVLLAVRQSAAVAALAAAAVAAFFTALSAFRIARSRFLVTATAAGFAVRDRHGQREFRLDQVICAGLWSKANYTNGVLQS